MSISRRTFLAGSGTAAASELLLRAAPRVGLAQPKARPSTDKFLLGVEYYRAPMPPQEFWERDFAAISRSGLRIVRTFSYWNWMEPQPGKYELEDFDQLFEVAAKHDLLLWFDITLATHGAAPEWMRRKHPDMRVVSADGHPALGNAGNAAPQGSEWQCYHHPKWMPYGESLLRTVVSRYKAAPNLVMWSVWDGIAPTGAHYGLPRGCYCEHSIAAYRRWLQANFSLDQLNQRLHRRYRDWADVLPARSDAAIVEMVLWREFLNRDLAEKLKWQVSVVKSIDNKHEVRGHGAHYPRIWDEVTAAEVDSWGYSAPSNNVLTSDDPYRFVNIAFASDWSRSIGRKGRWWFEEIYAGMNPGSMNYKKQTTPRELAINMWMALAKGAAGALFWQYRPEYMSFEAPGLNLMSSGGISLPRMAAVEQTIREISLLDEHLPLSPGPAEVAVLYHDGSDMLHQLGKAELQYREALRRTYRALWTQNIPVDVITAGMDWSRYRVVYLPDTVVVDQPLLARIKEALGSDRQPRLIADGLFGTNASNGRFSYDPPEGLAQLFGARTLDYTSLSGEDIRRGDNRIRIENGSIEVVAECNYVGLQLSAKTRPIAWYGDTVVGMETADRRFTWITFSLATALGTAGCERILLSLAQSFGLKPPVRLEGDRVILERAKSRLGGWLLFVFNLERKEAQTRLGPEWSFSAVRDLIEGSAVPVQQAGFSTAVPAGGVKAFHVT